MHRHTFANPIIRAHAKVAPAVHEAGVLRLTAQHGSFVNPVRGPERCEALDDSVRANVASFSNVCILFDHRVRPHAHVFAETSARRDKRCRISAHATVNSSTIRSWS